MTNPNCGICGHLNQRGFCNLTACIMPNIKTDSIRKIKQTNADRIRAMSDEELAEFLDFCPPNMQMRTPECAQYYPNCKQCWLDWLGEEADE